MKNIFTALVLSLTILLCACQTKVEYVYVPQEVKIPYATQCDVELPVKPNFVDTPEAIHGAANIKERTAIIQAGRIQRDTYIEGSGKVFEKCNKAPTE